MVEKQVRKHLGLEGVSGWNQHLGKLKVVGGDPLFGDDQLPREGTGLVKLVIEDGLDLLGLRRNRSVLGDQKFVQDVSVAGFERSSDSPDNTEDDELFVFIFAQGLIGVHEGNQESSHDVTELGHFDDFRNAEGRAFK